MQQLSSSISDSRFQDEFCILYLDTRTSISTHSGFTVVRTILKGCTCFNFLLHFLLFQFENADK